MNWKFWIKEPISSYNVRIKQILVPQTHRYTQLDNSVVGGVMKVTIHSRFIDVGRQDVSIIPPDDMP